MADHFQLRRTKTFRLDCGLDVRDLSDSDLLTRSAGAWDANQGDDLEKLRAEMARRGDS